MAGGIWNFYDKIVVPEQLHPGTYVIAKIDELLHRGIENVRAAARLGPRGGTPGGRGHPPRTPLLSALDKIADPSQDAVASQPMKRTTLYRIVSQQPAAHCRLMAAL